MCYPDCPAISRLRYWRQHQRHCSGFTLIELIISIILLGLMAAVGTTLLSDSFSLTFMMNGSQSSQAKARNAMERIEREIREVGATTTAGMAATSFAFTKHGSGASVTIALSGNTLTLNNTTLTDNVDSFGFIYRDAALAPTTTPAQLRFVDISLTVKDMDSGQSILQQTRVALRNIP
jgi:prepilin-type N-terminal cleavage/methylation domain-containing protein